MNFLQINWGEYVNPRYVKHIHEGHGKKDDTILEMDDGRSLKARYRIRTDHLGDQVVAAYPGFTMVGCADGCDPTKPQDIWRSAIIAWVIDPTAEEFAATPVTADGMADSGWSYWAVLQPDGQVIEQGHCVFTSLEKWADDVKERQDVAAKAEEKRKAEKAQAAE